MTARTGNGRSEPGLKSLEVWVFFSGLKRVLKKGDLAPIHKKACPGG